MQTDFWVRKDGIELGDTQRFVRWGNTKKGSAEKAVVQKGHRMNLSPWDATENDRVTAKCSAEGSVGKERETKTMG